MEADRWPVVGERAPLPGAPRTPDGDPEDWRLTVSGTAGETREWSLSQLRSLGERGLVCDVHCVTRWSKPQVEFVGAPLEAVLPKETLDATASFLRFEAHTARGHDTSLAVEEAYALGAFLAWGTDEGPLPLIHGGPLRLVVPERYFYKSLKWLARIEAMTEDRLGYWEREAGYHNHADPWKEERFVSPKRSREETRALLARPVWDGEEHLSLVARGAELEGLSARGARLRNANFSHARLSRACFSGANLSNARFRLADLRGADFRGADLEGADFGGADLTAADLRGASLFGATFTSPRPAVLDAKTNLPSAARDALATEQTAFLEASGATWEE